MIANKRTADGGKSTVDQSYRASTIKRRPRVFFRGTASDFASFDLGHKDRKGRYVRNQENLLNQRVSSVDAEASERSGSIDSEGISRILQGIIKGNGVQK